MVYRKLLFSFSSDEILKLIIRFTNNNLQNLISGVEGKLRNIADNGVLLSIIHKKTDFFLFFYFLKYFTLKLWPP